jgi:hypothetical protein
MMLNRQEVDYHEWIDFINEIRDLSPYAPLGSKEEKSIKEDGFVKRPRRRNFFSPCCHEFLGISRLLVA